MAWQMLTIRAYVRFDTVSANTIKINASIQSQMIEQLHSLSVTP